MIKLPKTISHKEFITLFKSIKHKDKDKERKIKTALILGFYQVMRVSEVVNLTPKDIDVDRGFIHIKNAKGKKDRDVPIQKPVFKFLKYLPIGYTDRHLRGLVKKYGKEVLGREDLNYHSLRHSGATFYLNDLKMDIRHVQVLLGHSRLDTTAIYTHVTPTALKEVTDKLWENLE